MQNVLYVGSGYVGALSAIIMSTQNPKINFTVFDINQTLIHDWQRSVEELARREKERVS